ncbi:MAG: thioredoxin family protein [Deltaproteobacteria bacterium]|nr:thioredoxin family protein [Candidatus Anaeroferrophillus wilburensis]MBN2888500.1 thioredoxin family protein [Deltaproteobacteria bacterium]
MFNHYRTLIVIVLLCLCGSAFPLHARAAWLDDFKAAKSQATREHKDLLLVFSGSDWCGWCIKLEQEVFSQAGFMAEAEKQFILVNLDFPQRKAQAPAVREQNQQLKADYRIEGFPTVILADAAGTPYARTGYLEGGSTAYLQHLAGFQTAKKAVDDLMTKAEQASGMERARLLDQVLETMQANHLPGNHRKIIDEIISLDTDNQAGLQGKYEIYQKVAPIEEALRQTRNFDQALTDLDTLLAEDGLQAETKQRLYLFKATICLQGKKDPEAGIQNLQLAAQAAPDTPLAAQIPEFITQIIKQKP